MKKLILLSVMSLSLVSGTTFADTPVYKGGVQIINTTSSTAIGHVYNSNNLIVGGAIYAGANSQGTIGFTAHEGLTKELYAGVSSLSNTGGVDYAYTTCFHSGTNQSFIYSSNPQSNQFPLKTPPTCNSATSN